jgi:peptide/nickel transport system permease protein
VIFIFRGLVSFTFTIWIAATVAFFLLRVLPGDALQTQLMQSGASLKIIEERRSEQGLNDSLILQYCRYLINLAQGNLGYSLLDGQAVSEMIAAQFIPTLWLALSAITIAVGFGLTIGILAVIDPHSPLATFCNFFISLSLSMPIYWTGTLAIFICSGYLQLLPSTGSAGWEQLILPASVLGFHTAGVIARIVRLSIREVITSDFIRTAKAKGLPASLIVRRHILRAGLIPIISVVTLQTGFLLSGTVITESLFVRPGIGRLMLDRTLQQDYPVVQGIIVLVAIIFAFLNMLSNFLARLFDPRIALE